jgi:tyrosyl-tRNA synthetase
MLGKESVRARLNSEEGMSFTEFSYQLLQAYDFYFLHKTKDICVQVGGSDQWGNIVAGIELIRKLSAAPAFGMTFPLLTRSDGKKFGKTEEGAVWLAADRFSPYQFYQYLVRIPDADVIKMMRLLTFMDMEEIRTYEKKMALKDYVPNTAQRRLAEEITRIVHGESGLESALRATAAAAPGAASSLDPKMLKDIAHDMPSIILNLKEVIDQKIVDLIVKMGLLSSKGETVRLIGNGGAYLNNEKIEDVNLRISEEHLIGGEYLLIGVGKKKKMLVNVER